MQHLSLKATTVSTDQELGEFEAIASAWDADREGDVIERTAFDKTITAWQESGKNLPLLFEHSTVVVGSIDPFAMHATDQGLVVYGEVDREIPEGRQVWKSIKAGTAGFSIGFMAVESTPRKSGGRTLAEIDLLEISATSTPMHPSARALSWKTADQHDMSESEFEAMIAINRKHTAEFRERLRRKQQDKELEEMIQEIDAETAREEKRKRPIKVKTFSIE